MSIYYGNYNVKESSLGYFRLTLDSLEVIEKEADGLLKQRNYLQASEKYYKISEEIVKELSARFAPNVMKKVSERLSKNLTPWTAHLLNVAVDEIIQNLNWKGTELERIFRDGWRASVTLHREGFHEFELTESDILNEVRKVKRAIDLAKKVLKNYENGFMRTTFTIDEDVRGSSDFLE